MNISEIIITQNPDNPADYNIKAQIYDDTNTKVGDFGLKGIDMFTWWILQDDEFRLKIVNQFIALMAQEIISGNAE
jgi:hypothetical protein